MRPTTSMMALTAWQGRAPQPYNSIDRVQILFISHRRGSCGDGTPTEAIPKSSMMRMWALKPGSCLMRPRACCRYAVTSTTHFYHSPPSLTSIIHLFRTLGVGCRHCKSSSHGTSGSTGPARTIVVDTLSTVLASLATRVCRPASLCIPRYVCVMNWPQIHAG